MLYWTWTQVLQSGKPSDHKAVRHGLYQWRAPRAERIVAFCFGHEFAERASSLKHQIRIKHSSWVQRKPAWTENPFVNDGGKNHTACWLAQSLCICSKVVQLQKQKYLQVIVNLFSSVFIQNSLWLLEVFSLPFKDHKVPRLWTCQCVIYNWSTQPQICSLGTLGSTRKLICLALFSEDWSLSQLGSLHYLSRRLELEKKERPFGPVSVKYVTLNHINGLLGPEVYLGIYSLEVCRIYVFKAVNSILIMNILRSYCIYILNYGS